MAVYTTGCVFDFDVGNAWVLPFKAVEALSPEFGGTWVTECLNTMFPLPILLFA